MVENSTVRSTAHRRFASSQIDRMHGVAEGFAADAQTVAQGEVEVAGGAVVVLVGADDFAGLDTVAAASGEEEQEFRNIVQVAVDEDCNGDSERTDLVGTLGTVSSVMSQRSVQCAGWPGCSLVVL